MEPERPESGFALRSVARAGSLAGLVTTTPVVVRPTEAGASIVSLERAVLLAPVHVADGVSMAGCAFTGAVGLDELRFSRNPFAARGVRLHLGDAAPSELRQLRRAAESSSMFQLAAALHIAQLDATRVMLRATSARRWALEAFRWIGGYGHRPSRPVIVWSAMCLVVTYMIHTWPDRFVGGDFMLDYIRVDIEQWHAVLFKVVVRNSLAVFSPLGPTGMHTDGVALLLAMKVCSTALFVFFAMGVRSRLRR